MDPTVTIHQDTLDDLMACAHLSRQDHRDILAAAVETVRQRHIPKAPKPETEAQKRKRLERERRAA